MIFFKFLSLPYLCSNVNNIQALKSSEVPYFLLALYEKATLNRITDSTISGDVSIMCCFFFYMSIYILL